MSHHNYSLNTSFYNTALIWLKRGCSLIPCQPNSKYLVRGFGPVRKTITTEAGARQYFQQGAYNLSVLLTKSLYCLDFDDWQVFTSWSDVVPAELQTTYQEVTPHGAHVFYRGEIPPGLHLVAGVEIKRSVLVAPSIVAGRRYVDLGFPGFLEIPDYKALIFSLLSEKDQSQPVPSCTPVQVQGSNGGDLVSRIKASFPITELVSQYTELKPSGRGERRWLVGKCPFHADHKPSLWVDADRQLWGCHSCGITGDAINFYARQHNLTLQAAIRDLAGRLPRV